MSRQLLAKSHSDFSNRRTPFRDALRKGNSLSALPAALNLADPIGLVNIDRIQRIVHTEVCRRMQSAGLPTSSLDIKHIKFLCPTDADNVDKAVRFEKLWRNPLFVSDEDMMMSLFLMEGGAANEGDGTQLFYVRSWTMTVSDFKAIIASWSREELDPPETAPWITAMAGNPSVTVVSIRYVGTCELPSTPEGRFQNDSKRPYGLPPQFLGTLQELFPDVYVAARMFTFPAATQGGYVARTIRDDRERAMIHFFGMNNLLNCQTGGFYTQYLPPIRDHTLFLNLRTDVFSRLTNAQSTAPATVNARPFKGAALRRWVTQVLDFSQTHPATTGTAHHLMPETLLEWMILQSQGSRAGYLTRDFLARLQHYEATSTTLPTNWEPAQLDPEIFAFADLYPFLRKSEKPWCMANLRAWMEIVQPFISLPMGQQVTGVVTGNFAHAYGIPTKRFFDHIVTLSLHTFADLEWIYNVDGHDGRVRSATCTVVIPASRLQALRTALPTPLSAFDKSRLGRTGQPRLEKERLHDVVNAGRSSKHPWSATLAHVLQTVAPAGAVGTDWMNDPQAVNAAIGRKAAQMRVGYPPDFYQADRQRERAIRRHGGDPNDPIQQFTTILEGREVSVYANARIVLLWQDPQPPAGQLANRRIIIPMHRDAVGVTDDDKQRFVRFLEHGIGLANERGILLTRPSHLPTEGVLRRTEFVNHADGDTLLRIWTAERARIAPHVQAPANQSVNRGAAALSNRTQRHTFPIAPNDAAWLFQTFLDREFPNGEFFRAGRADHWGDNPMSLTR
ncbi:uncharacterized protein EV422DRAFT_613953 [Fimicolochytrium jonesii]|uniref:uncharacterized protein n=1 Tax=Fimicolochytrium jonesii TaxID=1396493 RepID=UPI0022FDBD67|nr:uncharacterized protein EV422DRAFT_613953 [Fimicolochytrium jonesii]KAI8822617.1 hypothetical protein EV422DRAFT_613953 [Fimicolochytrium jonesii]